MVATFSCVCRRNISHSNKFLGWKIGIKPHSFVYITYYFIVVGKVDKIMAGTNIFVMTEKIYKTLLAKSMDLSCKCSFDCNRIITVFDSVVSKPAKHGRKYYLLEHYQQMQMDFPNNHHGEDTFFEESDS